MLIRLNAIVLDTRFACQSRHLLCKRDHSQDHFNGNETTRVRFAPSPTGHIHLGGLRAAFYNYVFAKQNNGRFVLRIEDTDQSRVVPGSANEIEHILNWAGLKPDESPTLGGDYGPYLQSQRLNLYRDRAQELLESGHAYRCFCSPVRLELLRKYQARNREKTRYDGKCRNLEPAEIKELLAQNSNKHVIRLKLMPGLVTFNDVVFGQITNNLVEALESDPILMKSDQYPTYHFANVVDDHAMKITHVLRGSEWISSTAKHIQLYRAFNWRQPTFAHFPLITMRDGSKMSKRNDDSHVKSWIDSGYSATTLFNFLTNIGGGVPKAKQDAMEVWSLDQFVERFRFDDVTCHPGGIDIDRLRIYSSNELKLTWQTNPDVLMDRFYALLKSRDIVPDIDDKLARTIIAQLIGRLVTLNDLLSPDYVFIWKQPVLSWNTRDYRDNNWNLVEIVEDLIEFAKSDELEFKDLFIDRMKKLAAKHDVNYADFMKVFRMMLIDSPKGLPVYEICQCLGQSRLLSYLENALHYVEMQSGKAE